MEAGRQLVASSLLARCYGDESKDRRRAFEGSSKDHRRITGFFGGAGTRGGKAAQPGAGAASRLFSSGDIVGFIFHLVRSLSRNALRFEGTRDKVPVAVQTEWQWAFGLGMAERRSLSPGMTQEL